MYEYLVLRSDIGQMFSYLFITQGPFSGATNYPISDFVWRSHGF